MIDAGAIYAGAIDAVAIVSGGMDSVTLLHYLIKRMDKTPAVISFRYGQKHTREIEFARKHIELLNCPAHAVLDLTGMDALFDQSALVGADVSVPNMAEVEGDPQPATYVPNRNMIFLALAAAYAENQGASAVYYGAQRHDMYGYWDTTPQFLAKLNEVYALNRKTPIQIQAPFVDMSKADIVRMGLEMGVDYGQTWSCYQGREKACGKCPTCAERLQAFREVGIDDPLPYED